MKNCAFTFLLLFSFLSAGAQQPKILLQNGSFVDENGDCFVPFGYNYLGAEGNPLIDDDWLQDSVWSGIEVDFQDMKQYGANTIRIHLQLNKFMAGPGQPNQEAFNRLAQLLQLAESKRLYLLLTGLGAYRATDQPAWYDSLNEPQRWAIQAEFWSAVAETVAGSNAVFSYDLMNEPVMGDTTTWLPGGALGGFQFVQNLTRTPAGRTFEQITGAWTLQMKNAIRQYDTLTPVTVGFIGCGPVAEWSASLDFISAHIYPQPDIPPGNPFCNFNLGTAIQFVQSNQADKPFVISEIAPLFSFPATEAFMSATCPWVNGWINHYGGKRLEELSDTNLVQAVQKLNLLTFKAKYPDLHRCQTACGAEVAVLEGCEPDPHLVACYTFDGGWSDGSGQGLHLEAYGTTLTTGQGGLPNSAAAISNPFLLSPQQYLVGPDDDRTRPRYDQSFSLVARVYVLIHNQGTIWAYDDYDYHDGDVVSNRDFTGLTIANAALNNSQGNANAFRFQFKYGRQQLNIAELEMVVSTCFPFNHWYQVGAVYDAGKDSSFLYVDGHLQEAIAHGLSDPWVVGGQYPMIGGHHTSDVLNPGYFNGKIDFLKYFDRALSPAEIADYIVSPQDTACAESVGLPVVPAEAAIRLFPNPATGSLYLECPDLAGPIEVTLFDVIGRPIYRQTAELHRGLLEIPTTLLPQGSYVVRVISGAGKLYSGKITILH